MSQIVTALREVIAERERLQAELAAMRETADATVVANINLASERDLARQQVDELMAEREVAAQAAKERAAAFEALQAQATALEATVAEKDGQNTELRDLIAKSNQQVAIAKSNQQVAIAKSNQQIATLQMERDRLPAESTGLQTELKDPQVLAEGVRQECWAVIKSMEDKAKAELEATVATALDDMEKAQTIEKDLKAELLALTADREQTLTFLRTVQDDVLAKASEIEALKQEVTEAAVMAANAARSNEEAQTALIAANDAAHEARTQAESEVAALKQQLQDVQDKYDDAVAAWGKDTWHLTEQLQTANAKYEGLLLQAESEAAALKAAWSNDTWQLTDQLRMAKENYEGLILQQEQSIQQLQNSLALLRGEQGQMAELLGVQIGAPAQ